MSGRNLDAMNGAVFVACLACVVMVFALGTALRVFALALQALATSGVVRRAENRASMPPRFVLRCGLAMIADGFVLLGSAGALRSTFSIQAARELVEWRYGPSGVQDRCR